MSTWIDTSRNSPILRIGIRSTSDFLSRPRCGRGSLLRPVLTHNAEADARESDRERIRQCRLRCDRVQIDAKMHDRLCDLRSDAADDAIGAHQPGGGDGFEQML